MKRLALFGVFLVTLLFIVYLTLQTIVTSFLLYRLLALL